MKRLLRYLTLILISLTMFASCKPAPKPMPEEMSNLLYQVQVDVWIVSDSTSINSLNYGRKTDAIKDLIELSPEFFSNLYFEYDGHDPRTLNVTRLMADYKEFKHRLFSELDAINEIEKITKGIPH